jgi:hypothetical protein
MSPNRNELLPFTVNGEKFEWPDEYIKGLELKELARIPLDTPLFLIIERPWENELILNETRVNLARPGIEEFISKEKHPDTIILTIETPKGKWENVAFRKELTISELILKVINKFGFAPDGNYQLKIKGQNDPLPGSSTLEGLHLKDHNTLVFIDLGKGAC